MAAENKMTRDDFRACAGGSMRPRRMAAENAHPIVLVPLRLRGSMRPRRMAAENLVGRVRDAPRRTGSMRPRRMAAENANVGIFNPPIHTVQ